MPPYGVERITIEVISAIACFFIVRFLIKIYQLTRETRYLGLPLGIGFLGASYAFSAFSYSPLFDFTNCGWMQLFIRSFAFIFLAVTYYFSKSDKKTKLLWNVTLGALTVALVSLSLLAIASPQISQSDYINYYTGGRVISLICLCYISIHALKSHTKQTDPLTLLVPLGYFFLIVDQYSSLIWIVDASYFALFGGLAFRLAGLVTFLLVSYKTFPNIGKRGHTCRKNCDETD